MKYIVSSPSGDIIRVIFVSNDAHAVNQLGEDGVALHALPLDAGHIDDSGLYVKNNTLVARDAADAPQHAGLNVWPVALPK